jgi:hypothetical protein
VTQVAYVFPPESPKLEVRAFDEKRREYIMDTMMQGPVKKNLETCASQPEYLFYASESDQIAPAFDQVLQTIRKSLPLRLTQ